MHINPFAIYMHTVYDLYRLRCIKSAIIAPTITPIAKTDNKLASMDIHGSDIKRNRHISNINIARRMDTCLIACKALPYPLKTRLYKQKALFAREIYITTPEHQDLAICKAKPVYPPYMGGFWWF